MKNKTMRWRTEADTGCTRTILETDSKWPEKFGSFWHVNGGFQLSLRDDATTHTEEHDAKVAVVKSLVRKRREEIEMLNAELSKLKAT